MNPSLPLLHATNLGRQLPTHWIWRKVNIEIQPGAKVAVVGPSGAGKSLLLRVLAGLDDAQEGQLFFQGIRQEDWKYQTPIVYPPFASQIIDSRRSY